MAFNTDILKSDIAAALAEQQKKTDGSGDVFADMLSKAIEKFVSMVQVSSNIPVSTTGSATAQTGFTTAKGALE